MIYSSSPSQATMKGKIPWLGWMQWLLGLILKNFLTTDSRHPKMISDKRHCSTSHSWLVWTHTRLSCKPTSNALRYQESSLVVQLLPHNCSLAQMNLATSSTTRHNLTFWLIKKISSSKRILTSSNSELVICWGHLSAMDYSPNLTCLIFMHLNQGMLYETRLG